MPSGEGAISTWDRQLVANELRRKLTDAQLRSLVRREVERMVAGVEAVAGQQSFRIQSEDLPLFIVDLYGTELLRSREVRQMLLEAAEDHQIRQLFELKPANGPARGRAGKLRTIVDRTWRPGKYWARSFVKVLDLPDCLAGVPDGGSLPATEEVEPYVPLPELHDFQRDLAEKVRAMIASDPGCNRGVLSLPTGAGKTRTVVEALVGAIEERGRGLVLWVAQREELCEQAVVAFREVWLDRSVRASRGPHARLAMPLTIHRFWGGRNTPETSETGVVVASIQQLESATKKTDERVSEFFFSIDWVVIDEAHHAITASYTALLKRLDMMNVESQRPLLGLTATPFRGTVDGSLALQKRFGGKLLVPSWANPVQELRRREILADIEMVRVITNRKFKLAPNELERLARFNDLPAEVLVRIGNDRERNRILLDHLLRIAPSKPVLVFACSVDHANALALLLRRQGRSAAAITKDTPQALRRQWIADFKEGRLQYLTNQNVLTTGFDAPKIEVLAIARPTSSPLLYEQMLGRGLRGLANGGKSKCTVLDMVDVIEKFGEQMSYARYIDLWGSAKSKS